MTLLIKRASGRAAARGHRPSALPRTDWNCFPSARPSVGDQASDEVSPWQVRQPSERKAKSVPSAASRDVGVHRADPGTSRGYEGRRLGSPSTGLAVEVCTVR